MAKVDWFRRQYDIFLGGLSQVPTLVLKLDFAKAFNIVDWGSLMAVLRVRGFNNTWCKWIERVLSSSLTAMLVNGGPWFSCCCGLRQGDPMSPYLFLLVADVLQTLIKTDTQVRHPLTDSPCTILQYADDTLILLCGELQDVEHLKMLLDQFSAAAGLKINFDKSTTVPMNIAVDVLPACLQMLECCQEGFPRTYLGLLLSSSKLKLVVFDPYVAKVDRHLAGWQASLLNLMGRTVLINTILDGQLSYIMSTVSLPPGAIAKFDKHRRGFLWASDNNAPGGCLVTWDTAWLARDRGGLSIKDIGVQNACLLLQLIHRLHQCATSSWARWV
jgi:hypothetical protein